MVATVAFILGGVNVATAHPIFLWVMFTLGFAGIVLAILSFLRTLLLAHIGKVKYHDGEVVYEIKSILNR